MLPQKRAAEAEKRARRDARKQQLTGWLPRRPSRQTGLLAERGAARRG